MKVKSESEVAQSCLTVSDLMDCSLPVSNKKQTMKKFNKIINSMSGSPGGLPSMGSHRVGHD